MQAIITMLLQLFMPICRCNAIGLPMRNFWMEEKIAFTCLFGVILVN